MDFLLYLPSVVPNPRGGSEHNTAAHYITKLPTTLRLDGNWNVGLKSISYTNSYFNVKESPIVFTKSMPSTKSHLDVITVQDTELKLPAGFYPTPNTLCDVINELIAGYCFTNFPTWYADPYVHWNPITNKITVFSGIMYDNERSDKIFLRFSSDLERHFGFENGIINWAAIEEAPSDVLKHESNRWRLAENSAVLPHHQMRIQKKNLAQKKERDKLRREAQTTQAQNIVIKTKAIHTTAPVTAVTAPSGTTEESQTPAVPKPFVPDIGQATRRGELIDLFNLEAVLWVAIGANQEIWIKDIHDSNGEVFDFSRGNSIPMNRIELLPDIDWLAFDPVRRKEVFAYKASAINAHNARMLGSSRTVRSATSQLAGKWFSATGNIACDYKAGLYHFYIYSNLVENSIIGDSMAPLLGILNTPPSNFTFGDQYEEKYDQIAYTKLRANEIDEIEIHIRDATGALAPFEFGRTNITLHFKKNES